jgi:hypothetical protein
MVEMPEQFHNNVRPNHHYTFHVYRMLHSHSLPISVLDFHFSSFIYKKSNPPQKQVPTPPRPDSLLQTRSNSQQSTFIMTDSTAMAKEVIAQAEKMKRELEQRCPGETIAIADLLPQARKMVHGKQRFKLEQQRRAFQQRLALEQRVEKMAADRELYIFDKYRWIRIPATIYCFLVFWIPFHRFLVITNTLLQESENADE